MSNRIQDNCPHCGLPVTSEKQFERLCLCDLYQPLTSLEVTILRQALQNATDEHLRLIKRINDLEEKCKAEYKRGYNDGASSQYAESAGRIGT